MVPDSTTSEDVSAFLDELESRMFEAIEEEENV